MRTCNVSVTMDYDRNSNYTFATLIICRHLSFLYLYKYICIFVNSLNFFFFFWFRFVELYWLLSNTLRGIAMFFSFSLTGKEH